MVPGSRLMIRVAFMDMCCLCGWQHIASLSKIIKVLKFLNYLNKRNKPNGTAGGHLANLSSWHRDLNPALNLRWGGVLALILGRR